MTHPCVAMHPKFNDQKYRHPNHNKLHLYMRPNSEYWWCRFYHQGKAHRASTKSKNKPDAETFAADWYFNKQVDIKAGIITSKKKQLPTVKDASIAMHNRFRSLVERGKRTQSYLDGIVKVLNKHILPYFGDIPVTEVTPVVWNSFVDQLVEENKSIAKSTIHQKRNALNRCLKEAVRKGWITSIPAFEIDPDSYQEQRGRVWFLPEEQKILLAALDENIEWHKHTPHRNGSCELRDYVNFILHSGLRVDEASNVRFSDIVFQQVDEHPIPRILIRNIKGKRGTGTCAADTALAAVYRSIYDRLKPERLDQPMFVSHHRDMFNEVLKRASLKFDDSGRKRDFISLRHTYICNKIIERVPVYDIAINCRTSPDVIDRYYAKHLQPELLKSINEKEQNEISQQFGDIKALTELIEAKKEKSLDIIERYVTQKLGATFTRDSKATDSNQPSFKFDLDKSVPGVAETISEAEKLIHALANKYGLTFNDIKEMLNKPSDQSS
jgi:integrase